MDPEHRESIRAQLCADLKFSKLQRRPRQMLVYLAEHYLLPSHGLEVMQAIAEHRLAQCKDKIRSKKSIKKRALKYIELAHQDLQQVDQINGDPGEGLKENLHRTELMYEKAIKLLPLDGSMLEHKLDLHMERARIRFRLAKYREALQDIAVVLPTSGHLKPLLKGFVELLEMKRLAIECMAAIELVDCLTTTRVLDRLAGGDPQAESLVDMILSEAGHSEPQSNYHLNTFYMSDSTHNAQYFRYLLDDRVKIKGSSVGRLLVAREEIELGSIVLVEKPYTSVVGAEYLQCKCNYCLKDLSQNECAALSCVYCAEVRFCSSQCLQEAWLTYHRQECGFLGLLLARCGPEGVHVFRMLSQVGLERALDYQPLVYSVEQFLQVRSLRNKSALGLTASDRMELYRMASSLMDPSTGHSLQLNAHHAMKAVELSLMLLAANKNILHTGTAAQDTFLRLVQLCFTQLRRVMFHSFKMGYLGHCGDQSDKSSSLEASGVFLLGSSLFGHSGEANVKWYFEKGHLVFKASKHIPPNETLTIDYAQ